MKCKTWSTKINNFVVRRLKYIKINNQQHLSTTTAAIAATTAVTTTVSTTAQLQQQITQAKAAQPQAQQLQQQQQYLATCSTMPAMSKDNTATAVSLNESNFSELKIKELSAAAQQQNPLTTATATTTASIMATTSRLPQHNHNQMQQHRQQNRSTCGCGESSYTEAENGIAGSTRNLTNGHTSPIAAAMAQNSPTAAASMQQRNIASRNCCRSQNSTRPPQLNGSNEPPQQNRSPNAAPSAAPPARRSPKDFIFGMSIGEGSFSNVYLGKDVQTKREYAIKVCEKRHIIREHKEEYIRREREVMHMLAGVPGFVNLSCTFQDERKLYFVMTYANNGDMLPWINKVGSFDVDCTRQYAAELVLACEQMHRRNIIHRDLKPDNILFDENMHTLIADFGSSKIMTPAERVDAEEALAADLLDGNSTATPSSNSSEGKSRLSARSTARSSDDDDNEEEDYETGSDEVDSPSSRRQPHRYQRRRRGSFVGTAQYVSPEVLQNSIITPSADLWALGCIIYQMISGLPPFRGSTEYVIFKEILACNLEFPEGFDPHAEDLVRKLLKIVPGQRLGAQDVNSCYTSIRSHPFFDGIDFDNLRSQAPPPINPNLPGVLNEPGFNAASRVFDNLDGLEPGLDAKQMSRILGWELGFGVSGGKNSYNAAGADVVDSATTKKSNKTAGTNSFDLSVKEKALRLQQQQSDKWHVFADNEVILKKGYINKRKGLFARKRMFLLTTGPRLIYIDPVQMIKKGEIPWSPELRVETKNFRFFLVVTPNRIYYLDDPTSCSPEWKEAIEKLHSLTYPELQQQNDTAASRIPATPSSTTTSTTATTTPSLPSQFSALSMAASGTTLTTPSSLLAGAATSTSPSAPHSKSHKPASN